MLNKFYSEEDSFHGVEGPAGGSDGSFKGLFRAHDNAAAAELDLQQQLQHFADVGYLHDLYIDVVSPPFQLCNETHGCVEPSKAEVIEPTVKKGNVFPSESFHILRKHKSRRLRLDGKNLENLQSTGPTPSTEMIIELAAEKFIQSASHINHPYTSSILGHSAADDAKAVQLILNLLSCAEKVGEQQYDCASKLLNQCYNMSSPIGTPIERLAFYFIEALYEKVDKQTGRTSPRGLLKKPVVDPLEAMMWPNKVLIAFHKEHPLPQITKFAGIQAIVDQAAEARNIHMIDLEIRSGIQCTILMQALADRFEIPIHHLRITAFGTKSREAMEETGRRLMSFARSLNLNFTFDIVMVEDILDLQENLFKVDAEEDVAVYAAYTLTGMVGRADRLEHMMRVIKDLKPCVMVITEMEANFNSPTFIDRFVKCLFFFGALFESLAECMKNDEINRQEAEATFFSLSIRNVLAAEGEERKIRHVSIDVWRAFFRRFGLVEIELSMSSVDQANFVLQRFPCGKCCTIDMNGKCLTVCWKGTPLSSLSAWKFK